MLNIATLGVMLRRLWRVPSPMNVWKRPMFRWDAHISHWEEVLREREADVAFLSGDMWPVGSTVRIRTPQRFITKPS